jgi:hypothetical protein
VRVHQLPVWVLHALFDHGGDSFDSELAISQLSPRYEFDAAAHVGRNDRSVRGRDNADGLAAERTVSAFVVWLDRFASRTKVTVLPMSCLPGPGGYLACGSPFVSFVDAERMALCGRN